jgi:hypothetical protein
MPIHVVSGHRRNLSIPSITLSDMSRHVPRGAKPAGAGELVAVYWPAGSERRPGLPESLGESVLVRFTDEYVSADRELRGAYSSLLLLEPHDVGDHAAAVVRVPRTLARAMSSRTASSGSLTRENTRQISLAGATVDRPSEQSR